MKKVESFELDHRRVVAPYIRKCGVLVGEKGDRDASEIKNALEESLKKVLEATEIPAANEVQCGNYRDLSLFGAKEYAKYVLEKGFGLKIYGDDNE